MSGVAEVLRELRALLVTAALCVLLGAPVGLVWAAQRPHLDPYVVVSAAESALTPQFTTDLVLGLLGAGAGVLAGLAAWRATRRAGRGVALGLALGGWLAMLVAAAVGREAAHPEHLQAVVGAQLHAHGLDLSGSTVDVGQFLELLTFRLRAPAVTLAFPVAACLVLAGLTALRSRVEEPAPAPPPAERVASWGSAAAG